MRRTLALVVLLLALAGALASRPAAGDDGTGFTARVTHSCLPPVHVERTAERNELALQQQQPPAGTKSYKQTDPKGAQKEWLEKLLEVVKNSKIPQREYRPEEYDCDDFAGDLAFFLSFRGYKSTFTAYWCRPPHGPKDYPRSEGHALTDVHAPDGTVVWIDPTLGGNVVDLDFNKDGVVSVWEPKQTTGGKLSEDECSIEVYSSLRAAKEAGVPIDDLKKPERE